MLWQELGPNSQNELTGYPNPSTYEGSTDLLVVVRDLLSSVCYHQA